MEFQSKLKTLRTEKGISQEALAKAIYVSRSAVAKWENGLGLPSDGNLQALCDYFEVEEDWLLNRQDLKKQITLDKRQTIGIIVALFGIVTALVYVMLGFTLTFHEPKYPSISMYYPPVSFFRFIVTYRTKWVGLLDGLFALFCIAAAVWTIHTVFALSSVLIPALKKHFWVCLWGNVALIALSAVLFFWLLFVTVKAAWPVFSL